MASASSPSGSPSSDTSNSEFDESGGLTGKNYYKALNIDGLLGEVEGSRSEGEGKGRGSEEEDGSEEDEEE